MHIELETLGKKIKIYPKYHVKSFDYQLHFEKWPKEATNNSSPGNNENRAIKNSDRQTPKALAT